MKCIGYVSDFVTRQTGVKIPNGISEIFNIAQNNNRKFNITSVLSYKRAGYFQIIEGEDEYVNQLIANIIADSRHENVRVLFDFPISNRSFPEWFMRLETSLCREPRFTRFITKYSHIISSLDEDQKKLIEPFFHIEEPQLVTTIGSYTGKKIKLLTWPDFALMPPSPENIGFCGKLISKECTYEELLAANDFNTPEELDNLLKKLEEADALVLSGGPDISDVVVEAPATVACPEYEKILKKKKPDSFYSKMKAFLRRGMR